MIPQYSRVVAIDDNEDHLQKITWGLGKAGFCPIPFLFSDGLLENPPPAPIPGIRVVFSDIHLLTGPLSQAKVHAANIILCLKKIVGSGPYVLIFWSAYPTELAQMRRLIEQDGPGSGLVPPIGYLAIDKNEVFKVSEEPQSDNFDAEALRALIVDCLTQFKTLGVVASWEGRAFSAASQTTDRLFDLTKSSVNRVPDWEKLLAHLACEAVGKTQAKSNLTGALDSALLPILEDQLGFTKQADTDQQDDLQPLKSLIGASARCKRPTSVSVAMLNARYLIDETNIPTSSVWDRGMVTELGASFVNSGDFVRAFDLEKSELIRREFVVKKTDVHSMRRLKLHVVELGPECDHVQSKITTHRYLLALLVPADLLSICTRHKDGEPARYCNESIVDTGTIRLGGEVEEDFHLLISCRSYMSLPARTSIEGVCRFRLRRALLEDVMHKYTSHARRPGVMRFFA